MGPERLPGPWCESFCCASAEQSESLLRAARSRWKFVLLKGVTMGKVANLERSSHFTPKHQWAPEWGSLNSTSSLYLQGPSQGGASTRGVLNNFWKCRVSLSKAVCMQLSHSLLLGAGAWHFGHLWVVSGLCHLLPGCPPHFFL